MRKFDTAATAEKAQLSTVTDVHDRQFWHCVTDLDKFEGDIDFAIPKHQGIAVREDGLIVEAFEQVHIEGNLLVIGGASIQWQTLIGNGVTTQGAATGYFNNANACISVGDSSTAAADTQTELQAATNRTRKAMDATYPLHTDTTGTAGSKSIVFRSTFATTDANYAWQEWGIFNGPGTGGPPTTGARMLNRKVESLGTKTSAATWVITITLSLA